MNFSVRLLTRDFSKPLDLTGFTLRVREYSFVDDGGPEQAVIEAGEGTASLWDLMEFLRCPVEILDEEEDVVWWGFVSQAEVHDGAISDAVSLEKMYNRRALAYTTSLPGVSTPGERETTAWAEDADSMAAYGTKELLGSVPQATADEAANILLYELAQSKYPIPITTVGESPTSPATGRLVCRGWWETLEWVYYTRAAGLEQNAVTDGETNLGGPGDVVLSHEDTDGTQAFGNASGSTMLETSFTLPTAWTVTQLAIKVRLEGAPGDSVVVGLYDDSSGDPSTLLSVATIPASQISDTANWVTFTLAGPVNLAAATPYHVRVSRAGALDGTNHYVASVDEALGYADGALQLWNGSAWVGRSPDADLVFRVLAPVHRVETSFQLSGGEAWTAANVQIYAARVGNPGDNLRVQLSTDSAGAPGTLLATGTFTGTAVPDSPAWLTFTLDVEVALSLSTTYHLQVDRTGSVHPENYYVLGLDEGLSYAAGTLKIYTGQVWATRDPDADLVFVIGGVEETTTQIETAMSSAEFITDVDIEDASGLKTHQYRNGDQRLLDVVKELLAAGVTGGGRLHATITKDRILKLFQEPARDAYAYRINKMGVISGRLDGPVDLQKCPVGVWFRRTDLEGEFNTERLVDLSKFYVQASRYVVSPKAKYTPTPRGAQRPFALPVQISLPS